jgi:TATA-binding protein-associated factor
MEKQYGQDVIDSLSVLEAVSPALDPTLWPKIAELFPAIAIALRSKFAIIRQTAARCFATICEVMTAEAMRFVIEQLIPLIGDAVVLSNRQGTAEAIYRAFTNFTSIFRDTGADYVMSDIVQKLDIKALPYVIFMVVPVLGRMSDSDDDIRSAATNTFASLVKMVPLEVNTLCRESIRFQTTHIGRFTRPTWFSRGVAETSTRGETIPDATA